MEQTISLTRWIEASQKAQQSLLQQLHDLPDADLLELAEQVPAGKGMHYDIIMEITNRGLTAASECGNACTSCPGCPTTEAGQLSPERLVKLQALRDDVRQKLAAEMYQPGGNSHHRVSWLRVECLLDEGDELQQALTAARTREAEALRKAEKWISVQERLPEEGGRYWCYVESWDSNGPSHYQWNCAYNPAHGFSDKSPADKVTHWQPLPSPPTPEEQKGGEAL